MSTGRQELKTNHSAPASSGWQATAWRPGIAAQREPVRRETQVAVWADAAGTSGAAAPRRPSGLRRVSRREVANFTAQLAIMVRTGVDVASALQTLVRQRRADAFRDVLRDVEERVLGGSPLSQALGAYEAVFGKAYLASVAAGETSGRLPDVLEQLAGLLRSELKLRNSLSAMLAYPAILSLVSASVLVAMVVFVLPRFAKIFADFDAPLPWITRMLLSLTSELHAHCWFWGPVLLGIAVAGIVCWRSAWGRQRRDHLALHLLVLRDVTQSLLIGRTCRLWGLMLESGVPLVETLRLTRGAVGNSLFHRLLEQLEHDVLNGQGLSAGLAASSFVPVAAAEMVATAERTGMLGHVSRMIGQHYEEEGEARLRALVALVEPALTLLLGLGVALLVMSVMFPLFDLSSAVKGR